MRRSALLLRLLACFAALLLLGAPPALAQNAGTTPDTPLDFDPARPESVVGWWTNDSELMRLEPNGAYQMWLTQDRFQRPGEVGAWRRSNYIFFELEPYRTKAGTRIKVKLEKHDGQTVIAREGMKAFRRTSSAPHVFADDCLGAWNSPTEQLLILESGRYEYRRLGNAPGITQHDGIWRAEGEFLFLAPDTPAVSTIRLQGVRDAQGRLQLATATGRFEQVRAEDPIVQAQSATATPSVPAAATPSVPPAAPTSPPPSPPPSPGPSR